MAQQLVELSEAKCHNVDTIPACIQLDFDEAATVCMQARMYVSIQARMCLCVQVLMFFVDLFALEDASMHICMRPYTLFVHIHIFCSCSRECTSQCAHASQDVLFLMSFDVV